MNSSATVSVNTDGSATVVAGNPDIGGTRVAQAMMVSEELGVPVERVRPSVADTDSIGYSDLTGGSRVCYATGMAVIEAARDVREQLQARAAKIWGIDAAHVGWDDGKAIPLNGATAMRQAAADASTSSPRSSRTPAARSSAGQRSTRRWPGPASALNICDIEVDTETGVSRVVRYTCIQDVGKAIHPSYVEGQMQGGAVAGHRLGAERGVHLRRRGTPAERRASSTTGCRSRRTCR